MLSQLTEFLKGTWPGLICIGHFKTTYSQGEHTSQPIIAQRRKPERTATVLVRITRYSDTSVALVPVGVIPGQGMTTTTGVGLRGEPK